MDVAPTAKQLARERWLQDLMDRAQTLGLKRVSCKTGNWEIRVAINPTAAQYGDHEIQVDKACRPSCE